jgi:hypothetical protein
MKVQVSYIILLEHRRIRIGAGCGSLMNSHRICERTCEEIVISCGQLLDHGRERAFLLSRQMKERRNVPAVREN